MARSRLRFMVAFGSLALVLTLGAACGGDDDGSNATEPPGTSAPETQTPPPTGTPGSPTATATPTPPPGAPAAPSNVTVSGNIPDLEEPVPPGQGEAGRISVDWTDESDDEDGFRIYSEECEQPLAIIAEAAADETTHGPLNPCRPARIGVAAFNADGESVIVWAE